MDARDFDQFVEGRDPLDAAAAGWMVRRQDGLTPEEEAEFVEWLAADPANVAALEQMEGVWGRLDELPDEGVEALKSALPSDGTGATRAPSLGVPALTPGAHEPHHGLQPSTLASPGRRAWILDLGRLMPQAATATLAFGVVGGGWYGWRAWVRQPAFEQSLATTRGQLKEVQLPDGSTLWLDTATRVDVRLHSERREVHLSDGQVLFAVQSNPEQPFDVLAGGTRVTVVGTRFSVRYTRSGLADDGSVNVIVEEGCVRVISKSAATRELAATKASTREFVELGAGESVTVDAMGMLGPVVSAAMVAPVWREGRISFNGTPLAKALAEFERYGDTGLMIRDPAVAVLRVNGSFDLRQVGAFARALPQVLPVRLRPIDGRTEITTAASGG